MILFTFLASIILFIVGDSENGDEYY